MRTDKKPTTGSPATKKAIKPAALPVQPVTLAPQPAAPSGCATSAAKPCAAPLAPTPQSVPAPAMAPTAKAVSPADREKLIEFEAYLLAEKNNFQGDPADYWRRGEAIVAASIDGTAWQGARGTSLGNWGGRLS